MEVTPDPTGGFGQLRELRNFSLVSSMSKLQRALATWGRRHPAAGKSITGCSNKPKAKGALEKPSSESAPALLLTQKPSRGNLWFSIP